MDLTEKRMRMRRKITECVDEEYEEACNRHGDIHSSHEGYGVLREEVEESLDEIRYHVSDLTIIDECLDDFWEACKTDDVFTMSIANDKIRLSAYKCIDELIQVISVVKRIDDKFNSIINEKIKVKEVFRDTIPKVSTVLLKNDEEDKN